MRDTAKLSLFSLLIGITLEPPVPAIRTNLGFNGFKLVGAKHIISLYADDMRLFKARGNFISIVM